MESISINNFDVHSVSVGSEGSVHYQVLTLLTLVITNLCSRAFLSLVSLACLAFYLFYWFLQVLNRKKGFREKPPQKKKPNLMFILKGWRSSRGELACRGGRQYSYANPGSG